MASPSAHEATPAAVQALLDRGADPIARDGIGETPLHWAAVYNGPAVVSLLLDPGADAKFCDKEGEPPVEYAAENPMFRDTATYWRLYDAQF